MELSETEARQTLGMVNSYHFQANPEPVTEEWLAYCREERDKRIQWLVQAGYNVVLHRGENLEKCGRYMLTKKDGTPLQEQSPLFLTALETALNTVIQAGKLADEQLQRYREAQ